MSRHSRLTSASSDFEALRHAAADERFSAAPAGSKCS